MAEEIVQSKVLKNSYRDSVELMRVASEIEQLPGVDRAALLMASPVNRDVLSEAGLLRGEAETAGPNDLVIAVAAEAAEAAEAALSRATSLLAGQQAAEASARAERPAPQTIAEAAAELPGANLAMISTPGTYATAEALKALKRGMHVFMFSDNVPVEDEIALKQLAQEKGLLMMGPDCGTAILDGVPLGFANAVRRGQIGLIGASGTGLQQVSCLVDRLGEGVSQAIGLGGRDLDERVGGPMMMAAIRLLSDDPGTNVLVLLSKPPSPIVAQRVLSVARDCPKPVVVNFLGGDPEVILAVGAMAAANLEEASILAVSMAQGRAAADISFGNGQESFRQTAEREIARLAKGQHRVRGLYSGGTLASEAKIVMGEILSRELMANQKVIDLGADEYTVGRPHPMIDFRVRNEQIVAAAEDPDTAVILLDVVLGYGAHPDPAGALRPAIEEAGQRAQRGARHMIFIASVCGTPADPQNLQQQEKTLASAGVILKPSNTQAARLAATIARQVGNQNRQGSRAA